MRKGYSCYSLPGWEGYPAGRDGCRYLAGWDGYLYTAGRDRSRFPVPLPGREGWVPPLSGPETVDGGKSR